MANFSAEYRTVRAFPRFLLILVSLVTDLFAQPIDREALVSRHSPVLREIDPSSPLSVGNGGFAFTVDVTGLQTLGDLYTQKGLPLETLARWAWHTEANPQNFTLADASGVIDTQGRAVSYPTREKSPAGQWLRRNPHDHPLGQLLFVDAQGQPLKAGDLGKIEQKLNLWTGEIVSRFEWKGVPVEVSTIAHPTNDSLGFRFASKALSDASLRVLLAFPRGHDLSVKNTPPLDWSAPETHRSILMENRTDGAAIGRSKDDLSYIVELRWTAGAVLSADKTPHRFLIAAKPGAEVLHLSAGFSKQRLPALGDWAVLRVAANRYWGNFWRRGAAVDFSGSTDSRADELERRVVLSQYLMAIQCGGQMPPQETGLTCSSWYGKHHTEMAWWHLVHFSLWGRDGYVANALDWFRRTLPQARKTAAERGLAGARWSKMVGPDGRESPGGTALIAWNQPHPIYLAELLYRADPRPATLEAWRDVVFETADCLASMLHWDAQGGRYVLGPPIWIAQELYDQKTSQNPTYELAYWTYALEVAQHWRERLGMKRNETWDERIAKRAALPIKDGRYVSVESQPDTWDNAEMRHDHPSFLMAYGVLPGAEVDRETMRRTLKATLESWRWEVKIWGWDYPMIAMTAARLGETQTAVDFLLKDGPNNKYLANGHCPQRKDLGVYLPANGALLSAVAMMAGGWDGAPETPAPGFPKDGTWKVRAEGFRKMP
jgi:hypothetical protein